MPSQQRNYTRIVIRHDSGEALEASPLWALVSQMLWTGEAVEVVEIGVHEYPDDEPAAE